MNHYAPLGMGGMRSDILPSSSYYPPTSGYPSFNPNSISSSSSISLFGIPSDATNSLYVDGVPNDATEREVAHIFRPYPGFQGIRLINKNANGRSYFLCFVDFENSIQATIALNTLQGYRFDKYDKIGLKISFANEFKEVSRDKKRRDR